MEGKREKKSYSTFQSTAGIQNVRPRGQQEKEGNKTDVENDDDGDGE